MTKTVHKTLSGGGRGQGVGIQGWWGSGRLVGWGLGVVGSRRLVGGGPGVIGSRRYGFQGW